MASIQQQQNESNPTTIIPSAVEMFMDDILNQVEESVDGIYGISIYIQPVKNFLEDILDKVEITIDELYSSRTVHRINNISTYIQPEPVKNFLEDILDKVEISIDELYHSKTWHTLQCSSFIYQDDNCCQTCQMHTLQTQVKDFLNGILEDVGELFMSRSVDTALKESKSAQDIMSYYPISTPSSHHGLDDTDAGEVQLVMEIILDNLKNLLECNRLSDELPVHEASVKHSDIELAISVHPMQSDIKDHHSHGSRCENIDINRCDHQPITSTSEGPHMHGSSDCKEINDGEPPSKRQRCDVGIFEMDEQVNRFKNHKETAALKDTSLREQQQPDSSEEASMLSHSSETIEMHMTKNNLIEDKDPDLSEEDCLIRHCPKKLDAIAKEMATTNLKEELKTDIVENASKLIHCPNESKSIENEMTTINLKGELKTYPTDREMTTSINLLVDHQPHDSEGDIVPLICLKELDRPLERMDSNTMVEKESSFAPTIINLDLIKEQQPNMPEENADLRVHSENVRPIENEKSLKGINLKEEEPSDRAEVTSSLVSLNKEVNQIENEFQPEKLEEQPLDMMSEDTKLKVWLRETGILVKTSHMMKEQSKHKLCPDEANTAEGTDNSTLSSEFFEPQSEDNSEICSLQKADAKKNAISQGHMGTFLEEQPLPAKHKRVATDDDPGAHDFQFKRKKPGDPKELENNTQHGTHTQEYTPADSDMSINSVPECVPHEPSSASLNSPDVGSKTMDNDKVSTPPVDGPAQQDHCKELDTCIITLKNVEDQQVPSLVATVETTHHEDDPMAEDHFFPVSNDDPKMEPIKLETSAKYEDCLPSLSCSPKKARLHQQHKLQGAKVHDPSTPQTVPMIASPTAEDNAAEARLNASEILQTLQHHTQSPTISDREVTPAFTTGLQTSNGVQRLVPIPQCQTPRRQRVGLSRRQTGFPRLHVVNRNMQPLQPKQPEQ